MNLLDNATNYDNFEDFVQENTGNRFKLISPIQARILTTEHLVICMGLRPTTGQSMGEIEF